MNKISKVITLSVVLIVAGLLAYGAVIARNDYSDDPNWCALIGSRDRERSLNPLSLLAYKWYIDKYTDVALRRAESQRKLLDGTYAKQVQEDWARRQQQLSRVAPKEDLSNPDAIQVVDRSAQPGLDGLSGFKFGAKIPSGACRYDAPVRPKDKDGLSYIVDGFKKDDRFCTISPEKKFTVVDVTPKSKLIFRIETLIYEPSGSVEDYLKHLEQKWGVARADSSLIFSNATVKVDRNLYSPMGIKIVATDSTLRDRAAQEAAEIKAAEIDNDARLLRQRLKSDVDAL